MIFLFNVYVDKTPLERGKRKKKKRKKRKEKKKEKTHRVFPRPPLEGGKRRKEKKQKKEKEKKTHRVFPRLPLERGKRRDASVVLVLDLEVELKIQHLKKIRIFRKCAHQYTFRYTNI